MGKVGVRNRVPPAQANYLAHSLLLALCKRYPGTREQPKSGRCELFWQRDPPLAGWDPRGSLSRWELILVPMLCAASKAPVVSVPPKCDASGTSTPVGLVGWVGRVSCVASPITHVRSHSLPARGLGGGKD